MMPKKNGFTLAKRNQKENPHVPILFLPLKRKQKMLV